MNIFSPLEQGILTIWQYRTNVHAMATLKTTLKLLEMNIESFLIKYIYIGSPMVCDLI